MDGTPLRPQYSPYSAVSCRKRPPISILRKAVVLGIELGIPTPAFASALSYYDGYRSARLPANLLQAQRDYFGAHTYERVDQPRGKFFHTDWKSKLSVKN